MTGVFFGMLDLPARSTRIVLFLSRFYEHSSKWYGGRIVHEHSPPRGVECRLIVQKELVIHV
jgi:hypothetical protein